MKKKRSSSLKECKVLCRIVLLYACLIGAFSTLALSASTERKELKVLGLIIASDQEGTVYPELQKLWRSYMHFDRDHFEMYFIKADPNLASEFAINGDTLWVKAEENLIPGILNKTIVSMQFLLDRIENEFDFVLRTNLSSFYVFSRFLKFLETLPKHQCYCAVPFDTTIGPDFKIVRVGSGAGFTLSSDLVRLLVENRQNLVANTSNLDDVVIGHFLYDHGVAIRPCPRMDFVSFENWRYKRCFFDASLQQFLIIDYIPEHVFHFRIKTYDRLRLDPPIYKNLVKTFYNIE
jgi:hypothetical protein